MAVDQVWVDLLKVLKARESMATQIAVVVGGEQPYACFSTAGEFAAILTAASVATPTPEPATPTITVYTNTPGDVLNVRVAPNTKATILRKLSDQTQVEVEAVVGGWHKLKGETAYISAQFVSDKPRPVPVPEPAPEPKSPDLIIVIPKQVSGYGGHVLWDHHDSALAKYKVFKAVNNPGAVTDIHQRNPRAVCINRRHYPEDVQARYIAESGGVQAAAQRWVNENQADLMALPFALHEGMNEWQAPIEQQIAFEIERVKALAGLGIRACVLNLGVGFTSDVLWRRDDMQLLLALVQRYDGAVGLHAYGQGVMSASTGAAHWKEDGSWSLPGQPLPEVIIPEQCWLALRVVRDRQVIRSLGLDPLIIATECGIDDCSMGYNGKDNGIHWPHGVHTRGWRSCISIWRAEGWLKDKTPEQFYHEQLAWWVDQTGLLACIYAHGDETKWGDIPGVFDTVGLL